MSQIQLQKHCRQRGDILRILKEDYVARMTSTPSINGALDMLGDAIAPGTLQFHLVYLEQQGYLQAWRNQDLPGFRKDRLSAMASDQHIRFAKLTAKGLMLIDGHQAEDSMVLF